MTIDNQTLNKILTDINTRIGEPKMRDGQKSIARQIDTNTGADATGGVTSSYVDAEISTISNNLQNAYDETATVQNKDAVITAAVNAYKDNTYTSQEIDGLIDNIDLNGGSTGGRTKLELIFSGNGSVGNGNVSPGTNNILLPGFIFSQYDEVLVFAQNSYLTTWLGADLVPGADVYYNNNEQESNTSLVINIIRIVSLSTFSATFGGASLLNLYGKKY